MNMQSSLFPVNSMQTSKHYPKVLVVTPSYNQGAFIRDTIESVLSQDYPNLEYLVIDGGSTDETVNILREYDNDPRFRWTSEPDEGQADAIHKGFMLGESDILAWLCSDDYYLPDAISTAVSTMTAKNAQFVFGNTVLINKNSGFLRYLVHSDFHPKQFKLRLPISQPACFWTRELYEKTGGIDLSLVQIMDRDLFWRMSRFVSFVYIPSFLSVVRIYKETKTSQLFGTVQRDETAMSEKRMGESLPLYFAQYLPYYEHLPIGLQYFLRGVFTLYNTPLRFVHAPRYVSSRIALNVWWYLKSLPHRGKPVSELINSLPSNQNHS